MTGAPAATSPPGDASSSSTTGAPLSRPAAAETCPLCGTPLDPRQDWCLRCGAAARTRLAATPNWKGPIAAIAVLAALALGVLTAALVKLAGDSGSSASTTTTVTTAPTASAPATTATPSAAGTAPSTPATTATTPTTGTGSPTVTAQPGNAGGLAAPSNTPTVTAKTGATPKAPSRLTPAQRKRVEKFLHPGAKAGGGP